MARGGSDNVDISASYVWPIAPVVSFWVGNDQCGLNDIFCFLFNNTIRYHKRR
ncbi:hypothetical protein SNOG_13937 [Parastagonospora nodorum SN15]|uniref:Uncharacterized protein n=1 Tax=Phaeosphaeria nodorum (strain SN15 / ATCC MYA-4574 / FGSC 10173) TaxID=321614 RepID=Q0U2Q8_PHANO|nr:hypothetical protein SNOG_13937 [Parastagonospora nodorum SN15]EAT78562.1 hypothetical protein SNOG_13937 [Parastagonospora nodorum SN15]